jgi:hypothetical protein
MSEKPFYLYRYLMGAMPQNQLTTTVRLMCTDDEQQRLPEIIKAWRGASAKMVQLAANEPGAPDTISVERMPEAFAARCAEIESDPLFQASFSDMPTTFEVVEIDKLVAPQREVNLDYVAALQERIPGKGIEDLIEFCVGPRTEPPEIRVLQTAQNQMTYSSRSLDLRFLGGSPKPITEDDIKVAHMGGQPANAIALLVGFGAAPLNAYQVGSRLILANGFHRIVALRSAGISNAPMVVRHVSNPEIEFPESFIGLSSTYLLQNPRPVVVGDFFDEQLTIEVHLKPRRKVLKVAWGQEDSVTPE